MRQNMESKEDFKDRVERRQAVYPGTTRIRYAPGQATIERWDGKSWIAVAVLYQN